MRAPLFATVAAATLLAAAACGGSDSDGPPRIKIVPASGGATAFVEVAGLTRAERRALGNASLTVEDWQRVFTVSVPPAGGAPRIPIVGKYSVNGDAVRFVPSYPFDPGRNYDVAFDPRTLVGDAAAARAVSAVVALAPAASTPDTYVTRVFPSGDTLPENQLRMYIHFSAPMGRRGGITHIKLLDDQGREVEEPFLPLDAEFWNGDRTRYTVFFDPGRQKRGILPNREMGPSLVAGKPVTLVVDREWLDGNGKPLRETFTRRFAVGGPDRSPLDCARWKITPPAAGSRDPLVVTFPEPLDHGLLLRAIGVRSGGKPLTGEVRVDEHETRWSLTPTEAWRAGSHELIALSILEDLAGNRIGRAFEVDAFERVDEETEPAPTAIPFEIR